VGREGAWDVFLAQFDWAVCSAMSCARSSQCMRLYKSPDLRESNSARACRRSFKIRGGRMQPRWVGAFQCMLMQTRIELAIEAALPCGMIVCELPTNSIEHTFPGKHAGEIRVAPTTAANRDALTDSNNGISRPADFAPARATTFG
jgi:hypothetical protein